jgi:hypothetical protein
VHFEVKLSSKTKVILHFKVVKDKIVIAKAGLYGLNLKQSHVWAES